MSELRKSNEDLLDRLLMRDGWWLCKYCGNENWQVYHRKEEITCPETGKSREDAEVENV